MASIYYDTTAKTWREKCGCSGGDKTYTPLANTQPLLFAVASNQQLVGASGKKYFVRPNMVALDITATDAQDFINKGKASIVLPSQYANKQGYRAVFS